MNKRKTRGPDGQGRPPRLRPGGGGGFRHDPFAKRRNQDDDDYYIDRPRGGYWSDEDNNRYAAPLAQSRSEKVPGEGYSKKSR